MNVALITGSGGLIGSKAVEFFSEKFDLIIGIDNDLRSYFFGDEASTNWNTLRLQDSIENYKHFHTDIRNQDDIRAIFDEYRSDIKLIIHAAAQPSHDWAAKEPFTDFNINANGTLLLLEMTRQLCPDAVFIFCSTNKVYGDLPNRLPLIELDKRWELVESCPYYEHGIDEKMSIDQNMHSLFGASKVAADILVQEYGHYFQIKTVCFRGGCLTGPLHSGAELHGFLAYLVKCFLTAHPYTIYGYKGKQVRDNIHVYDLINMFWHFFQNPRPAEVYNAGGGRYSNCSILEALQVIEKLSGKTLTYEVKSQNRIGDHIWWISDVRKFKTHYPRWDFKYTLEDMISEIIDATM